MTTQCLPCRVRGCVPREDESTCVTEMENELSHTASKHPANTAWAFAEINEPEGGRAHLPSLHFTDAAFSRGPPLGKKMMTC